MSSLAKNFLISPVLGFAAFLIDHYVKTGSIQLPDNTNQLISLGIYVLVIFAGAFLVSYGQHPVYEDDAREGGSVKWFNSKKGYGFITRDQGDDVFVHYRDIVDHGRHSIADGQRVTFIVVQGDKGLQAEEVEIE